MAQLETGIAPKKKKKKKQSLSQSVLQGLLPWKGDSTAEICRKIVFLAGLIVMVVAIIIIANNLLRYGMLENNAGVDEDGNDTALSAHIIDLKNTTPTQQQIEALPEGTINEEYAALYEANNDFIGWINIPGTNVDYPVMQGDDNEYYLHKDFDGNDLFAGTIFTDYEGVFGVNQMPNNTIIYGHNMLYKYQFSALSNYARDVEFLKLSPVINFNTLYQNNKYKIISVMRLNTTEEYGEVFPYTQSVYFKNSSEFYNFILEAMDRSIYETGVDVEYGDELLTLSTCDEAIGLKDLRIVIVARKVRENESPEVDTSAIYRKKSIKYYDGYYEIYGNTWHGRTWDISKVKGMEEYIKENGLEDESE